jgi:hypothetical protein
LTFLGDAHPSVVIEALNKLGYSKEKKLKLDYVKLSHHGSALNFSPDLLDFFDCESYVISTDGSKHNLPNKKTLASIAKSRKKSGTNFYFNYRNKVFENIFTIAERLEYNLNIIFPNDDMNYLELNYQKK